MNRTVIAFRENKRTYYTFLCGCGNETVRRSDSTAKACGESGCTLTAKRSRPHGRDRIYRIWEGIRGRCLSDKHHSSKHYYGRGIGISSAWDQAEDFRTWALANGYTDKLTIDRIDIDGNYSPENCEWVTREENSRRQSEDEHKPMTTCYIGNTRFPSIESTATYLHSKSSKYSQKTLATYIGRALKQSVAFKYEGYTVSLKRGESHEQNRHRCRPQG